MAPYQDDGDGANDGRDPADDFEPPAPETQTQLARWFGGPAGARVEAAVEVADEQMFVGGSAMEIFTPEQLAAKAKAHEEAIAAVDPALLEAISARADAYGDAIRPLPPIHLPLEGVEPRDFSPPAWGMRLAEGPRETERPEDIGEALAVNTPQAVLRDLYRPEIVIGTSFLRPIEVAGFEDPSVARRKVREAMARDYRWEALPPVFDEGRASLNEVRQIIDQPWDQIEMPERPELTAEERIAAFASFGGVDPDV